MAGVPTGTRSACRFQPMLRGCPDNWRPHRDIRVCTWMIASQRERRSGGRVARYAARQIMKLAWWYWVAILFAAGMAVWGWFAIGPSHPAYAPMVVSVTFGVGPIVGAPVLRFLPRHWFLVPRGERVLHRMLGVRIFGWLLDRTGWNRHVVLPLRGFNGSRSSLPSLELSTRAGAGAHGACFLVHVLLAVVALLNGHRWIAALWMLLPGVFVHLYPFLLQRSIMLRLQPLLERSGVEVST